MDDLDYKMLDTNNWLEIAKFMPGRNDHQCKFKFYQFKQAKTKKIIWSQKEDNLLKKQIKDYGLRNWNRVSENFNAVS